MTTLEEVAAAILDGHEALSLLRVMSVDTMHLLEHEYEETGNEDVLRVLVLAHHLYRRITEDERLAEIPPDVLEQIIREAEAEAGDEQ